MTLDGAAAPLKPPLDLTEWADDLARLHAFALRGPQAADVDAAYLADLGTRLFRRIFAGSVVAAYQDALAAGPFPLGLSAEGNLAALPWELLSIRLGTHDDIAPHFAQALLFSLQVTPRLALETVGQMQHAATRLLAGGQAEVAAGMAAAGLQVIEALLEKLEGEKQQVAALCRAALQVVGLAATGERQRTREQARQVDEATDGMFRLAAWVEGLGGESLKH